MTDKYGKGHPRSRLLTQIRLCMNVNDYTYHLSDRFVLLFIAFIGLLGTSYILMNGEITRSALHIDSFSVGIHEKAKTVINPQETPLKISISEKNAVMKNGTEHLIGEPNDVQQAFIKNSILVQK